MSLDRTKSEFEDEKKSSRSGKAICAFKKFENESEFNDNHGFEEFGNKNEMYYKSEVAGHRSGQEIGTKLHLPQVRGCRPLIRSGNLDWILIFIYYKSKVSGHRSGQEIGRDLHLPVRGRRPIRSGKWDWSSPTTSPRSQADRVRKFRQDQLPE